MRGGAPGEEDFVEGVEGVRGEGSEVFAAVVVGGDGDAEAVSEEDAGGAEGTEGGAEGCGPGRWW